MKKLRYKVFLVIFGILSVTALSILIVFNLQDYNREKNKIDNSMMRLFGEPQKIENKIFQKEKFIIDENIVVNNLQKNESIQNKRFIMDFIAYAITFDKKEKKILDVTSHFQDEEISNQEVIGVASEILNKHDYKDFKSISNLYFEKYSFAIKDNIIVIIYNSKSQERLMDSLKNSSIVLLMVECIILIIAIVLTNWIIKPVEKAFNKQKQFIEDASHELKTPLTVIMASAEALEKNQNEKKWLENIKEESEKMSNLVSGMLEMAKTERCEVQYKKEDLSKIIRKSILTYESLMYDKSIKFDYYIEDNIDFLCSDIQIKQVMGILIDNAIQHSNKDGEIYIALKKEKNEIKISVSNKGEDIPKQEQEKIFERFYRADESRNRANNRYGLGLAIAKNIIENHKGIIYVESIKGITTFYIIFK